MKNKTDEIPAAGIGHNSSAPVMDLPPITKALNASYAALLKRQADLMASYRRVVPDGAIETDEQQKKVADLVGMMANLLAIADRSHDDEKEPFLRGGRLVDEWFKELTTPINTARAALSKLGGDYLASREQDTVSTDAGATVTLTQKIVCTDFQMDSLDLNALRPYLKRDTLAKAIAAWVKANSDEIEKSGLALKGATLERENVARYRR